MCQPNGTFTTRKHETVVLFSRVYEKRSLDLYVECLSMWRGLMFISEIKRTQFFENEGIKKDILC